MSADKATAAEVIRKIKQEAGEASAELRFVRTVEQGDEIRQGDVYLYAVRPYTLYVKQRLRGFQPLDTLQLAPGTSPGARHVIVGDATAHGPLRSPDPLEGPLVEARARVVLTHPEHAHISLPPGFYEVRYQRDWTDVQQTRDINEFEARRVYD